MCENTNKDVFDVCPAAASSFPPSLLLSLLFPIPERARIIGCIGQIGPEV